LRKKCFGPKLGKKGSKRGQNGVFGDFLNFASLEIAYFAYSSSFQQCLATSATKLAEKKCFGPKLGPFRPKLGPKWGFRQFSQLFSITNAVFAYSNSFQYCLTTSATKLAEKFFGP
jgi:hypothetical protein